MHQTIIYQTKMRKDWVLVARIRFWPQNGIHVSRDVCLLGIKQSQICVYMALPYSCAYARSHLPIYVKDGASYDCPRPLHDQLLS